MFGVLPPSVIISPELGAQGPYTMHGESQAPQKGILRNQQSDQGAI